MSHNAGGEGGNSVLCQSRSQYHTEGHSTRCCTLRQLQPWPSAALPCGLLPAPLRAQLPASQHPRPLLDRRFTRDLLPYVLQDAHLLPVPTRILDARGLPEHVQARASLPCSSVDGSPAPNQGLQAREHVHSVPSQQCWLQFCPIQ